MSRFLFPVFIVASLAAAPAYAQDHKGHDMQGMEMTSESAKAFADANEKMHKDMAIEFTGKPDVDFVRGMIPHHQGAIDMVKIVLQYGKDPEVKKLAEGVIAAQEKEIAWMTAWLAKNAKN